MKEGFPSLWRDQRIQLILVLFVFFLVWRFVLFFQVPQVGFNPGSFAWGATYQILALIGAFIGLSIAREWGGWKSTFGRSVSLFSIGLFLQSFGQAVSSFYVYRTGDVPYPATDDIGFFGSVIFYIFAVVLLSKVTGVKAFFRSNLNKLAIVLPILLIIGSYFVFLKGYMYDWSNPLQTFLDFGYPIFEAVYVGVAIMTLIVSSKYLGGMMKGPILVLLFALVMQYLSDFVFLYQASRNLYIPEGVNDCMYFFSYFLMAFALIFIGNTFRKIANS